MIPHTETQRKTNMTTKRLTSKEKLIRLNDILIEDILSMSDEEIIAEAKDHFNDPQAEAQQVHSLIQAAILRDSLEWEE